MMIKKVTIDEKKGSKVTTMKTYIRKIEGKWYAFAGDEDKYQVYSIGRDNPDQRGCRWFANWTDGGIRYVASPSPTRAAAYAKAK